jgi:cytochrome c oxidase subunit 3
MSVKAHDGPLVYPDDKQFGRATPSKISMWMFLGTDAMTFAGFLLGYAVLRVQMPDWPNPVEALGGVYLSGFMTFVLIVSSLFMALAVDACKQRNREKMLRWLMATIVTGAFFLGLQMYEYNHLIHDLGMTFTTYAHGNNLFATTFFAITGFHGLHVLAGVLYLVFMYTMAKKGRFDKGDYHQLEIAALFWYFVELVWVVVFTFVYLI